MKFEFLSKYVSNIVIRIVLEACDIQIMFLLSIQPNRMNDIQGVQISYG